MKLIAAGMFTKRVTPDVMEEYVIQVAAVRIDRYFRMHACADSP